MVSHSLYSGESSASDTASGSGLGGFLLVDMHSSKLKANVDYKIFTIVLLRLFVLYLLIPTLIFFVFISVQ